jgi:hypothetical protein
VSKIGFFFFFYKANIKNMVQRQRQEPPTSGGAAVDLVVTEAGGEECGLVECGSPSPPPPTLGRSQGDLPEPSSVHAVGSADNIWSKKSFYRRRRPRAFRDLSTASVR